MAAMVFGSWGGKYRAYGFWGFGINGLGFRVCLLGGPLYL